MAGERSPEGNPLVAFGRHGKILWTATGPSIENARPTASSTIPPPPVPNAHVHSPSRNGRRRPDGNTSRSFPLFARPSPRSSPNSTMRPSSCLPSAPTAADSWGGPTGRSIRRKLHVTVARGIHGHNKPVQTVTRQGPSPVSEGEGTAKRPDPAADTGDYVDERPLIRTIDAPTALRPRRPRCSSTGRRS